MRVKSISLASFLIVLSCVCCNADAPSVATVSFPEIDGNAVLEHTRILSSDAFEGRGPGTKAEEKTVNYIVEEFKKAGLGPGNADGTFVQAVPLVGITANADMTLTFQGEGRQRSLKSKDDFVAWTKRVVDSVELKDSDVVFVGYGVKAPEYDWDDYKGVDVTGKTLIMLVGDPAVANAADPTKLDPNTFGGKAMTYYGRWTYKYEIGAERGAAAVLIVHETEPAGYPFSVVQGNVGERFDLVRPDKNMGRAKIEGWIPLEQARDLFKMAGQDYDALKRAAATRAFKPVEFGLTASLRIDNTIRTIESRNVLGRLEGSDPTLKDEYVIYTSHWDHLGIGEEIDGDSVYHGAVDNATGIGGLIEIARAFARLPNPPRRSILFLAATAEEQGLLGSAYYAANPVYPLAKTVGVINMDTLNVHGKTSDVVIMGLGNSDLDDVAAQVAADQGRAIKPDPTPEKGGFYRSDHFPFAQQGVPALSSHDGVDYVGRPAGYGMQIMDEYIAKHYHKPSDVIRPDWDMSGAVQQLQYYWMVGRRVAEADQYPQWKPGAEFKRKGEAPLQAREFPLSAVKLLDGPFRRAMETDKAYLLRLEPDRLLAGFRREAGLPKKAEPYGGWETIPDEGRYSLAGQALGHYLSALSLMASGSGDPGRGAPLRGGECRRRVDAIVDELAACQKAAGTGILCAFPESKKIFAELSAGQIKSDHLFGLNGGYVPLYVTHKVMAGLRDAWLLLGNETAKEVLVRMADWLATVFEPLTDAQIQEILETEHGGIMEVLVDVYAITGERKHLVLAKRLNHKSLFDPLTRREDCLTGQHANAQIPKVIGMERIYQLTGEPAYGRAARFFWDDVVNTRTFVIGGHGENEFFFAPDAFATQGVTSPTGPETCNTYNMLKLSRRLWLVEPSVAVADYIERALYNHVLSSQEPDHGGFVYFTSMRPGHYRTYSSDTEDFWCCTDTGMESQAKYGEFIYAHSDNRLWVDLLIPSQLDWAEQGVTVRLDTRFPEDGKATLTLSAKEPRKLAIAVRCPGWLKSGSMRLAINGVAQSIDARPGSYAVIEGTRKTGDRLDVDWPLTLRTEMLPTSKEWISVLWGPVVLAGELGVAGLEDLDFRNTHSYVAQKELPLEETPVFVGTADDVTAKVEPVAGRPLTFRTTGLVQPADVTLAPFYRVHCQRYAIYWRLMDRVSYDVEHPKSGVAREPGR